MVTIWKSLYETAHNSLTAQQTKNTKVILSCSASQPGLLPVSVLSNLPWHCVPHSVMRFWRQQTPCCGPPDQFPQRVLRISQEASRTGRWLALTSGDVSCMATWHLTQRCLPPQVLSRITERDISERGTRSHYHQISHANNSMRIWWIFAVGLPWWYMQILLVWKQM